MPLQKYPYYLSSIINLLTKFEDPTLILGIFTGLYRPQRVQIGLRESNVRLNVRNAMDIWSVKETFVDRFYERFGAPVQDGWTIIDIGAGLGDFTIFAAYNRLSSRVFAYEPFAESYELLKENISLNRIDNAQIFNQAVGAQTGYMTLDLSGAEPLQIQSSNALHQGATPSEAVVVPSLSLADVFVNNSIDRCDLLKLDCEGAEYNILFSADNDVLSRIHRIVMEYHDDITEYSHGDMARFLSKKGYRIKITPNYVHEHLGYLYASRERFHGTHDRHFGQT